MSSFGLAAWPGFRALGRGLDTIPTPMPEPMPVYTNRIQCVECGRVSEEDERG